MNENAASLAALNVALLEAIAAGAAAGPTELAERAGLVPNNIGRKLESLAAAGLVEKTGPETCDVALTEAGRRGLAAMAVWRGAEPPVGQGGISYIPLSRLRSWPGNPRKHIPPKSVLDMAQSVSDRGIETPITVRAAPGEETGEGEGYEVLFGQRRFLGSQHAASEGWIAADSLIPCQVRSLSDAEAEEAAGVENLQREDMHWADLAQYFRHMMDERRLSGPQLERLFGGRNYSARKIQDYAKIARELPQDVLALAYAPAFLDAAETRPNPQHLTYTKARDLVGEKKERPALELSPRLTLTLLEILSASGLTARLDRTLKVGEQLVTRFASAPSGGPIGQLANDKKLIAFGFEGRDVVARTTLTEDMVRFLQQLAFDRDPAGALYKARAAVAGELQATTLASGERYVTPELNMPTPDATPSEAAAMAEGDSLTLALTVLLVDVAQRIRSERGDFSSPTSFEAEPTRDAQLRRLEERGFVIVNAYPGRVVVYLDAAGEAFLKRKGLMPSAPAPKAEQDVQDEAPPAPAAASPAPPPAGVAPAAVFDLPPMLAIVVIELAHKISAGGLERGPGTWAAEIRESFYRDARVNQLVQGHRAIAVMPLNRDRTLACLTARALAWLADKHALFAEQGKPMVGDAALRLHQQEYGFAPEAGGLYSTYWLNAAAAAEMPAQEPAAPETPAPLAATPTTAEAAPTAPPRRDVFMQQIMAVTAEPRAIARLAAALREARVAIGRAKTRKLTPDEAAQLVALIDSALEAAEEADESAAARAEVGA